MRRGILLWMIVLAVWGCQDRKACSEQQRQDDMEAVTMVLERYIIANETKQLDLIRRVWAPDSDIMVFGTDSDERLVGWDQIKQTVEAQFRQFEETYIAMTDPIIKVNETCNTAWFSAILNYSYVAGGKAMGYEGLRFTGVLEKKTNQWYIVQSHISLPADRSLIKTEELQPEIPLPEE